MLALGKSAESEAECSSSVGGRSVGLACVRTGAWPASADAMAPEILINPPVDPFSGRPFVFERLDGRMIVHSVGPNLRDEHGADEPKRWGNDGPDDVGATAWDVAIRRQPPP
jgi:hypothetical protein